MKQSSNSNKRIITRCYHAITALDTKISNSANYVIFSFVNYHKFNSANGYQLYAVAVKCFEYVTRFSRKKIRTAWNKFCKSMDALALAEDKWKKMTVIAREVENFF